MRNDAKAGSCGFSVGGLFVGVGCAGGGWIAPAITADAFGSGRAGGEGCGLHPVSGSGDVAARGMVGPDVQTGVVMSGSDGFPVWHRVHVDRNGDPAVGGDSIYPDFGRFVLVSFVNQWTQKPQVYAAKLESSEESLTGYKWMFGSGGSVPQVFAWAEFPLPCPMEEKDG